MICCCRFVLFARSLLAMNNLRVHYAPITVMSQPAARYVCCLQSSEAGSSTAIHVLNVLDIFVLLFCL